MTSHAISLEERFWSKVDPFSCVGDACGCHQGIGHCWPWTASINNRGYGQFRMIVNEKWTMLMAHRVAFMLTLRPLAPGMECCHHCDYRRCCRVDHLFEGTRKENAQDAAQKGRISRKGYPGELNIWHKVTDAIVKAIREAPPSVSHRILAVRFGIDAVTVSAIQRGASWKHIDIPPQPRGKGFASGERHWSHLHPERLSRGPQHGMTTHPSLRTRGERQPNAKLTEHKVKEIRALKGQKTCKALAEQFSVSPALICLIQNYKVWTHLT